MKRLFLAALFFLVSAQWVVAVNLDATVRLERQKTGTNPLPVLIIVKANSNVIENGLTIDLGSGWAISNSVNVSTVGLPSGVSPLPLINNGSGSGSMISFPGGDLNTGVSYGFFINNGIGINPGTTNNTWIISTGGNSVKVNVPILGQDQVSVTGKVGALASDFQIGILPDNTADLAINDVVTYEITFGSYLVSATKPLVVTGSWSRGTVFGSPTPSVDIVDYVIGSGSTGLGGVLPVIDLVNRKITWTFANFPANTLNKKVTFQLKVNNSYSGQSRVRFDVDSTLSGANVVTTNSSISNYYQPATVVIAATPTSNSGDGNQSSSVVEVTPTATPIPIKAEIQKIEIVSLSDSNVGVLVGSNTPGSNVKISYGLSANNLKSSITSINNLVLEQLNVDGLIPDTDYFFKVEVKGADGKVVSSDIYTFKTASTSDEPSISEGTLQVSVNNNVILGMTSTNESIKSAVMVPGENYAFRVNLKKPELVKHAIVFVRDTQVLGITSVYGAEPNSIAVDLSEIVDGGFVGHLVSPSRNGYYDIVLRIESLGGGISENKIGVLKVINSLKIEDTKHKPIENAKVLFYQYNKRKYVYELIPQQSLGINNPSYTESDGSLRLSLPNGKYRVLVSSIGFRDEQNDFIIGLGKEEKLPTIEMTSVPITLVSRWTYYATTTDDVLKFVSNFLIDLSSSSRLFKLLNIWNLVVFGVVCWKMVSKSGRVRWWMVPLWTVKKFKKHHEQSVWGSVVDELDKLPISGATVYLLDGKRNTVVTKTESDILGNFEFSNLSKENYRLAVEKKGYESNGLESYSRQGLVMGNLTLKLENIVKPMEYWEMVGMRYISYLMTSCFSLCLLLLFLLELLLWSHFGLASSWFWVLISGINLVMWWK